MPSLSSLPLITCAWELAWAVVDLLELQIIVFEHGALHLATGLLMAAGVVPLWPVKA